MSSWKIQLSAETQFSAPLCFICVITVFSGVFDPSYEICDLSREKRAITDVVSVWSCVLVLFCIVCAVNTVTSLYLANTRKITTVDFYFASVLSAFSLVQIVSHLLVYTAHFNPQKNDIFIKRTQVIENWSSLLFLGWSWAWSRHVRRGW